MHVYFKLKYESFRLKIKIGAYLLINYKSITIVYHLDEAQSSLVLHNQFKK